MSTQVGHKRLYLGATAPGEASPLRGHRHVAWALTLKSGFANFAGLGTCRFVYEAVAATLRAAGAAVGPGLRLLPDPIAVTASPGRDVMAWQGGAYLTTLPEFENNWIHVEDREDPELFKQRLKDTEYNC